MNQRFYDPGGDKALSFGLLSFGFGLLNSAKRIPKSEFDLAAAFAEKDNLYGFEEDSDFQKEGHKTD